jgi:tRNA (guanine-N7-)-methyltransferase
MAPAANGVAHRSGPRRPIRSFVKREGRLTPAQQRAIDALWPRYGLDPTGVLDWEAIFGRQAPVVVEIGFGNGATLVHMAGIWPHWDFIGIEVHRPGIGRLLRQLEARRLSNVRVIAMDAVSAFGRHIPEDSLERVLLLFPDPWPKSRHHKRRIVQAPFVDSVGRGLRPGGILQVATDWQDYAQHILDVMAQAPLFSRLAANRGTESADRPLTRFEQRGLRLGHRVWEQAFQRVRCDETRA